MTDQSPDVYECLGSATHKLTEAEATILSAIADLWQCGDDFDAVTSKLDRILNSLGAAREMLDTLEREYVDNHD